MTTLVVGCSFVDRLDNRNPHDRVNRVTDNYVIRATSGSGNQSMAARVIHECSKQQFDQVVIIWSGINRLDFPIGQPLHRLQPRNSNDEFKFEYFTDLGDVVYYHSGGWRLSGTSDTCPKFFRDFFESQYRSATPRYLSDLTLQAVIQTQHFLEFRRIPYQMSFIYDIDADYSKQQWEPGCGQLDRSSPLNDLVNWNTCSTKTTLFEYAQDTHQLSSDGFHPTFDCMVEWFQKELNIGLKSWLDVGSLL